MSAVSDFQEQYGAAWVEITGHPAFTAALAMANAEKIQQISVLTDTEIHEKGTIILSSLRGHLQYEAALLSLTEKKDTVFADLGEPDYPNPIQEALEEEIADAQLRAGIVPGRRSTPIRKELSEQRKKRKKRKKK